MTATAETEPKAPPAWTLLRERMFRRYWSAAAVSFIGDQITLLALPLLAVLVLGATPAEMGYLTAAGLAPNLVLALAAGVWVDRRRHRRHVMVAADVARALLVLSIPVTYGLGALGMSQLYVVAFLIGACSTFFEVANGTLFVSLVKPHQYVPASSLINGARAMSFVAGPSAAGWLVQLLSAPIALIADAVSYLYSAVLLGRTKADEPAPEHSTEGQYSAGFRFLRGSRALSSLLLAVATVNLFNYMFAALMILYITLYLGVTPGLLGLVLGAASVGRAARLRGDREAQPGRRGRPGVRDRSRRVSVATAADPARRRPEARRADAAVRGGGAVRAGRDDPRHHGWRIDGGHHSASHAVPRVGHVPHHELRHPPGRCAAWWCAGNRDRRAHHAVDRGCGGAARRRSG